MKLITRALGCGSFFVDSQLAFEVSKEARLIENIGEVRNNLKRDSKNKQDTLKDKVIRQRFQKIDFSPQDGKWRE